MEIRQEPGTEPSSRCTGRPGYCSEANLTSLEILHLILFHFLYRVSLFTSSNSNLRSKMSVQISTGVFYQVHQREIGRYCYETGATPESREIIGSYTTSRDANGHAQAETKKMSLELRDIVNDMYLGIVIRLSYASMRAT